MNERLLKKVKDKGIPVQLINKIINKHQDKPGELLNILEEIQQNHPNKYLPSETLENLSKKLNLSLSQLYGVVTFYAFFNLKPQGDHSIVICRGTACHTHNSRHLLESLGLLLGFSPEDLQEGRDKIFLTTKDKKFTIKTVACFGQCALAPVVEIDGVIYSQMTQQKLQKIVNNIGRKRLKI